MRIHTNKLDINKFKRDFDTLYRGEDKEQVLNEIVELINESSDVSIPSFLRNVDLIEDKKVQKLCRHAAVAQMYNAGLNFNRCSSCYVETSSYGQVVMIKLPISTVILSKYGDILFNEGEIWTHSGLNYGKGFIVRKIIDGQVSTKYGFIDNAGARVLPCIFDYIEGHIGEADIYYGPHRSPLFSLSIYGNKESVDRDKLQKMIDDYDVYAFNCISEDSILFSLLYLGRGSSNDLMEELRTALSPILISKEKLQEIVESK